MVAVYATYGSLFLTIYIFKISPPYNSPDENSDKEIIYYHLDRTSTYVICHKYK